MLVIAHAQVQTPSPEALIRALAGELCDRGAVRDSFADAVLAREAASPTGVPLAGGAIALPHSDPEHVLAPAIAVATLTTPVAFRQMGDPAIKLGVRTVLVLALRSRDEAQATLVQALRALQSPEILAALQAAPSDAELAATVEALWKS